MPLVEHDVLIIGAGAAGLTAARDLSDAGLRVVVVEARSRLGGRIHTLHLPAHSTPLELGAEFVHGRPPSLWNALPAAGLAAYEVADEHWEFRGGRLKRIEDFWGTLDKVLGKLKRSPDESFAAFAQKLRRDAKARKALPLAMGFVEGFNAADAHRIGTRALLESQEASEEVEGDQMHRLVGGYDGIVRWLVEGLRPEVVNIRLSTVVNELRWKSGFVIAAAYSTGTGEELSALTARRAIVTVPLGVLKAAPGTSGAIRFVPDLPRQKMTAIQTLEMGPVVKVLLTFRIAFWEKAKLATLVPPANPQQMTFLHTRDLPIPTWWTLRPMRSRTLVGWAGGPAATALSALAKHKGETAVVREAVHSLAAMLGIPTVQLREQLDWSQVADWQADPFARGAYSYVQPKGLPQLKALARPVEGTLFFAGEATDSSGVGGTVDSALRSGKRAAKELLEAIGGK